MKKNIVITPVGLKGNQINERMKELMGIAPINETKSSIVVELTKTGPDGGAYAIIRENHKWFVKKASKTTGLVAEDFKYIGGLQNKFSEAYDSYNEAVKQLNFKFRSLAEAYNYEGEINIFKNDYLLGENAIGGLANMNGNGFSGEGNISPNMSRVAEMEGFEEEEEETIEEEEEIEMSEAEKAIDAMIAESGKDDVEDTEKKK